MSGIASLWAREVLDAQGNAAIEVEVGLESGHTGRASVPVGTSWNNDETHESDNSTIYAYAVADIEYVNNEVSETLFGMDALKQETIDATLVELDDGVSERQDSNALLGVSIACARAAANFLALPLYQYLGGVNAKVLPVPLMTILQGGATTKSNLDIQEIMLLPVGALTFDEAMRMGAETFHCLRTLLHADGFSSHLGSHGEFVPNVHNHAQAFSYIVRAIEEAGYTPRHDIALGMNVASSQFYHDKKYTIASEGKKLSSREMVQYLGELVAKYPLLSIEDGVAEHDREGWARLHVQLGSQIQLVGNGSLTMVPDMVSQDIGEMVGNSLVIKPYQLGTLSETLDSIELARQHGFTTIISPHESETQDPFVADLVVGTSAGQIKTGSLGRTDRMEKYNQLLRIEEELEEMALYYGSTMRDHYGEYIEDKSS